MAKTLEMMAAKPARRVVKLMHSPRAYTLFILIATLAVQVLAGYLAFSNAWKQRKADAWSIQYMELERQGNILRDKLRIAGTAQTASILQPANLADFGLEKGELKARWNILQVRGEDFFAHGTKSLPPTPSNGLKLSKVNIAQWLFSTLPVGTKMTVYAITREGKLIFANHPRVTPGNFMQRTLVTSFIKSAFQHGIIELSGVDGETAFGFYQEVSDTNIVLFAESPTSNLFAELRTQIKNFAVTVFIVEIFIIIATYYWATNLAKGRRKEVDYVAAA